MLSQILEALMTNLMDISDRVNFENFKGTFNEKFGNIAIGNLKGLLQIDLLPLSYVIIFFFSQYSLILTCDAVFSLQ